MNVFYFHEPQMAWIVSPFINLKQIRKSLYKLFFSNLSKLLILKTKQIVSRNKYRDCDIVQLSKLHQLSRAAKFCKFSRD
ncbi:hypothetical protein BpHYR1_015104 [Brachionus plicatilis]|uniref:Uncharacterized protein n=1 Tax=Brachionus plicatilis TaxID=10195 RepID=A0A3M7Q628_BRAPC|nr:hypothetical protein BpHYR1_015104 [Brachionus plicatilis]